MAREEGSVLIIARPGGLQDGLSALMGAARLPLVVHDAMNEVDAHDVFRRLRPRLVLLEGGLPNGRAERILAAFKAQPGVHKVLVLTVDVEQGKTFLRAGADAALVQGSSPDALLAKIEGLLKP